MATPTYRVATLRDVEQLADCAMEAMMEDHLFAGIFPRRKEDPQHFRLWFKRRGKRRLTEKNIVTLVAELPVLEGGTEKKKIVGFAYWQKYGKETMETRWNPVRACENKIILWEDWIASFFDKKDPTVDLSAVVKFHEDTEDLENIYWKKDGTDHERWHLHLLGVHPTARRKGIGAMLVELGLQRAKRDGCDAGLESSPLGLSVYKSKGFEVIGVHDMKLKGVDGSPLPTPVLLWKNPAVKGEA